MLPYYAFALAYLAAVMVCFILFAINMFLLAKFGFFDFVSQLQTVLVLGAMVTIIVFTGIFLRNVDWQGDADVLGTISLPTGQQ